MANLSPEERLIYWNSRIHDWSSFELLCTEEPCIKAKVVFYYKQGYVGDATPTERPDIRGLRSLVENLRGAKQNFNLANRQRTLENFNSDVDNNVRAAAHWIWRTKGRQWVYDNILTPCAANRPLETEPVVQNTDRPFEIPDVKRPFDKRLDRLEQSFNGQMYGDNKDISQLRFVPFSSDFGELSTTGYLISQDTLRQKKEANEPNAADLYEKAKEAYKQLANDEFYKGVPALQNYYALVRLYGSDGGKYLMNQKGKRRWYEVDSTVNQDKNFASTPTTSALISWGQGDPYGRTPYQFTDFVFSKYWNKIQNNRLITLRRYAAPILDNLKFPGMVDQKVPANVNGNTDVQVNEEGTSIMESVAFPPMATAVTYFGENTGNSLNNILKFTTGVLWDEVQASVWDVTTDNVPSNTSGPGTLFGGIAKFAEMLNVAGGNFDRELIMAGGNLPPDPYENGPYENRIRGPINRIDKILKRTPGLAFQWDGLNLVFEYVARPVGGINPKAVLLDIMSNFLVMGSASAVFFGGAHRFMANPAKYPFLGGQEGIERWYRGDPIGWGLTTVKQFTQGGANPEGSPATAAENIWKSMEGFFSQLFSGTKGNIFGAISNLFTDGVGNLINNYIAKKTAGQVPYLQGLKAILTGEPVGEWHVTIGNPLNPIAMIGNLICEGIEVEFNEELGPDDFPTEIKITVKLKHAMARDRDAIESVFNRGMGRIYNLPDSMSGSADYQTVVDAATQEPTAVGYMPGRRLGILKRVGQDSGYIPRGQLDGKDNPMGGETSVWNRSAFRLGISENSAQQFIRDENEIFLSSYRAADWIAQRALQ